MLSHFVYLLVRFWQLMNTSYVTTNRVSGRYAWVCYRSGTAGRIPASIRGRNLPLRSHRPLNDQYASGHALTIAQIPRRPCILMMILQSGWLLTSSWIEH